MKTQITDIRQAVRAVLASAGKLGNTLAAAITFYTR